MEQDFKFYLDIKKTIWEKMTFTIKADSLEEAKLQAVELCKTGQVQNCKGIHRDYSFQSGSEEEMTPEENRYEPTKVLYCEEDDSRISDNDHRHLNSF
jgi:CDGSH-type Zn-finger protein